MSALAGDPNPTGGPPEPSSEDFERLRVAAGWARFAAIAGFVVSLLLALVMVATTLKRWMPVAQTAYAIATTVVSTIAVGGAAGLVWAFAQNVSLFFVEGEPALARAFRRLRYFFIVWTLFTAYNAVTTLYWFFARR